MTDHPPTFHPAEPGWQAVAGHWEHDDDNAYLCPPAIVPVIGWAVTTSHSKYGTPTACAEPVVLEPWHYGSPTGLRPTTAYTDDHTGDGDVRIFAVAPPGHDLTDNLAEALAGWQRRRDAHRRRRRTPGRRPTLGEVVARERAVKSTTQ